MASALVLVHSPAPGPGDRHVGTIRPALREQGFDVAAGSLVPGSPPVPGPEDLDLLVIMGSAASAYDDGVPWLPSELAFLDRALDAGTPVLGICFGAQLLARALGGTVTPSSTPERGFVTLGSADPALLPAGTWMAFHYDAFTLPPGAQELARNEVCLQGFTHGVHMGVQFHPEITPDVWDSWMTDLPPDVRAATEAAIDVPAIAAQVSERAVESAAACRELVARHCARLDVQAGST